jgi:Fic family protein
LESLVGRRDLVFTTVRLERFAGRYDLTSDRNLTDELTAFLQVRDDASDKIIDRSRKEIEAFELLLVGPGFSASMGRSEFIEWIQAIHHAVTGCRSEFRRGGMRTRPDARHNTIVFPPPQQMRALLEELHNQVTTVLADKPALAAVAAYVGLIHCHPFLDGNGRAARVLFNLLLSRATGAPIFIPLSYWSYLCRGSFVLKVRRAMYGGDWPPLLLFLQRTVTVLGTQAVQSTRPKIDSFSMRERRVS